MASPARPAAYSLSKSLASASLIFSQADGKNSMMAAKKSIATAMSVSFMASSPICSSGPPGPDSLVPCFPSRLFSTARKRNQRAAVQLFASCAVLGYTMDQDLSD